MDQWERLHRIVDESFRRSRDERQDSPQAMMRAVGAVREAEPGMGEADAFALVWSLWRP
ncbi:MAG: hypothetical protein NVV74_15970 [Magnetospirillum sp.]|nr:hypothetical protein [Magnetospirillum sp.]